MKIYVAEEAGFCFGVKRALDIINRLHEKGHEIQVYGQLIHNRSVLEKLKAKGIDCIDSLDQLDPKKTLVIRTHGVPKEVETELQKRGVHYVDATCSLVKKLQKIIETLKPDSTSHRIVIIGDRNHPEILAAHSYSPGATVIDSEEEANNLEWSEHLYVLAQTTLDADFFRKITAILKHKTANLHQYNTICNATRVRQAAVKKLAPQVDGVIVVGGKNSSNTRKLYQIALRKNKNTFLVEKSSDLECAHFLKKIVRFRTVGLTAGASTPPEEIEKIENFLININANIAKEMNHG
jgi:4-hydroxy-3-methylbut-2-en-1-yl diphosphate reductase